MVERVDPARTGVRAGRLVGLLTAALAVVGLLGARSSFDEGMTLLLALVGVEWLPVEAVFWGAALLAATTRYAVGYVVGSLVGVVYDWLDRPSVPVLTALVLVVGVVDGTLSGLDARSVVLGAGHLLAWLCYVPAFVWLFNEDAETRSGPHRLGES
jgi:XapX domain-containing protein